ncbi:MAG: RNA polymerase sigma-70 factor (ECF subfamily) [Flavobacterium sp.]|jgi:RNA polymerase sigma-70 factor (ECF subfamily)
MFAPKSDDELIARALEGSERAWLAIVKKYEKRLFNYSLRMSGNREDAMDILQDVLISVYRNLKSYRGDGKFAAWLFRIASFRCIDYFRKRSFHTSIDDLELPEETGYDKPDLNLSSTQSNRDITELMSKLPLDQRQVVELKYFQSFTFDEISGQLGISTNTAKTRLYSALGKMRKQTAVPIAV